MSALLPRPPLPLEPLAPPVTICVLCYGNYPELAARVLGALQRFTAPSAMRLRIGLNAVDAQTKAIVQRLLPTLPVEFLVESATNLYKLPMMRRLFHDVPLTTPWTIWFDDDSFVRRSDWLPVLACESTLRPEVDMWGQKLFIRVDGEVCDFGRAAPWFRGKELLDDDQPGKCRIDFVAGGYWAIRTRCLHELDWPDRRLLHFGDDYLLGEALRQNGFTIGQAVSGVAVSQAHRRAPADTPRCAVLH